MAKRKTAKEKLEEQESMIEGDAPESEMKISEMLSGNNHKYLMVNLLARRATDLKRGARPLVQLVAPFTPLEVAISEGAADLLRVEKKKKEVRIVNLVEAE